VSYVISRSVSARSSTAKRVAVRPGGEPGARTHPPLGTNFGFDTKSSAYTGLIALLVNILVSTLGTLALRAAKRPGGHDATEPGDYTAELGDPAVAPLPVEPEEAPAR
jgi:hypothetical protein